MEIGSETYNEKGIKKKKINKFARMHKSNMFHFTIIITIVRSLSLNLCRDEDINGLWVEYTNCNSEN